MKLHASGEDYLETILLLQKEKGMVRSVDVARYMEVSKPSVCHAVSTLKEGGFFTHLLTEAGVDPKTAEQEACRMEHVISESSFRHLKQSMDKKE